MAIVLLCAGGCIDKPPLQDLNLSPATPDRHLTDVPWLRYLPVTFVDHTGGISTELDREAIESYGLRAINVWEPGIAATSNYQGVRFSDFIRNAAGQGVARVVATSFHGSRINFTFGELLEAPYMLVTRENDTPLHLANRGPLLIVIEQEKLSSEKYVRFRHKWARQIVRLDVYGE